jgi:Uncharacterised nucleotidyltransferase
LLRAFDGGGVAVMPLKGPFLAERMYGGAALRVSRDLDLLVGRCEFARAEAVLSEAGFVPGEADDYHRAWHRLETTVELHHDVENPLAFDFDVASALRRAQPAVFHGQPCRLLAPEDELLFLCLHGARHRYERLSLIVDLKLAFEKLPETAAGWKPRAEVARLDNLMALGLAMVRRLQPGIGVTVRVCVSSRQAEQIERVADRLWQRLLTEPCDPLDWSAAHSFYIEIEAPGWPRLHRRFRHLQILMGRLIESDYAFAARFGLHRGWQVRMLRPVRLLSESMRPPRRAGRSER